jgi:hypothetical protein
MPSDFSYRLKQFQQEPPSDTWQRIADELDNGRSSFLSQRLKAYEQLPPEESWEKISQAITPSPRVLWARRLAMAAITIGIAFVVVQQFTSNSEDAPKPTVVNVTPVQPDAVQPASIIPPVRTTQPVAATRPELAASRKPAKTSLAGLRSGNPRRRVNYASLSPSLDNANGENIRVAAPPIRDQNGNIIMDLALISSPDTDYVTVTGPNGTQTRLSKKFLDCITYLNDYGYDHDYMAQYCRGRFTEWRETLAEKATLVPAASNFFDIFELKDLLLEQ